MSSSGFSTYTVMLVPIQGSETVMLTFAATRPWTGGDLLNDSYLRCYRNFILGMFTEIF